MDRFREIESFVAVVEAGSFVRAGDVLRVSKAAISRSVLDLEHRLGVRLLERTTRRLSLTEAGRAYFDRSKQLLADLAEADSTVNADDAHPVGSLRINAPYGFGVRHLAGLWGPFMARHPEIRLEVVLADRVVDLVDEGFDVGVRILAPANAPQVSRMLARTRSLLCASPAYLVRRGMPMHPADLRDHELIAPTSTSDAVSWHLHGPADEVVAVRPRLVTNNADTAVSTALAGQGIVFGADFALHDELASGHLVPVLPAWQGEVREIHAVYPARKQLSIKVRMLLDHLAESLGHAPWIVNGRYTQDGPGVD